MEPHFVQSTVYENGLQIMSDAHDVYFVSLDSDRNPVIRLVARNLNAQTKLPIETASYDH